MPRAGFGRAESKHQGLYMAASHTTLHLTVDHQAWLQGDAPVTDVGTTNIYSLDLFIYFCQYAVNFSLSVMSSTNLPWETHPKTLQVHKFLHQDEVAILEI